MITFDTHELAAIAVSLDRAGFRTVGVMTKVFDEVGGELVKTWAANARETSGVHGKHYPDSIDKERVISTDIVVEVGPNPNKKQGRMSFENGSVNQPPHLDGQRAADLIVPALPRRVAAAIAFLGL